MEQKDGFLGELFQEYDNSADLTSKKKKKNIQNHSTQDSRVVPHRGTNWAALWLTAQIRRDAVFSKSYGRGYLQFLKTLLKGYSWLHYKFNQIY